MQITEFLFQDDGVIPNNPVLPALILQGALDPDLGAAGIGRIHKSNGWGGNWVYTVFDYHHWHPDAHEALSVARGWADLALGGPKGQTLQVRAGDTLILPAGTGHCRLDASADFAVCGCYPRGQEAYSTRRGMAAERVGGPELIAQVPFPGADPLFGAGGPLMAAWGRARAGG